uniref:RING-type E3 ubiquitin transferase n=1 Tax=Phallusia mammillata TaxID=59560 RepID=A0A6F9DKY8_9ASCI|nr:probable E3 ubiquitin-protein ligase MARCH10 [Phallusia mammillata]
MSRRKPTSLQTKSMSNISSLRTSTKEKTSQDMKSLMNNRHQATYHKSAFTLSDLNHTSDASASATDNDTMCRICQSTDDSLNNQQVTPCSCSGSLQYVHMQCLQQWRQTKKITGADVSACELCKQPYNVQLLGSTDVPEDRIMKMQEDLKQLVKSGIYLMLLMRSWKSDFQNAQRALDQQQSQQTQSSTTHSRG